MSHHWSAHVAGGGELDIAGQMLHEFNIEFGEPTPPGPAIAERLRELVASPDTVVLLVDEDGEPATRRACGVAVIRLREAIWSRSREAYLAELYVQPAQRGRGAGRVLMNAVIEHARNGGATTIEIGVDEPDAVARRLYESLGFSNRTGEGNHLMFVYEREL
jgi:ribosomal protein S18 acetylase RimI-like enzyme